MDPQIALAAAKALTGLSLLLFVPLVLLTLLAPLRGIATRDLRR